MSTPFNPLPHRFRNRGWTYHPGDMYYVDDDGIWQAIERPSDWATIPYFLGIDQVTGIPTWMSLSGEVTSIVRVGFIASTLQLFPPTITRVVSLPLLGPTAVLYPPLLESIDLPLLASTVVLYPPTVIPSQLVAGGTISSTQLFVPTILTSQEVTGGTIPSATQLYPPSTIPPQIWMEMGREDTISGGKLTLSGLDPNGFTAIRFLIDGITVTSDDTPIFVRFLVDGVEETGDLYQWSIYSFASGSAGTPDFNTEIRLTDVGTNLGVGNAASDSFSATLTLFDPGGTLHKIGTISHCNYMDGAGNLQGTEGGVLSLDVSGDITGIVIYGSSNLTGGTVIALGIL